MGNVSVAGGCAPIQVFYSSAAWIEGAAIEQLGRVAALADVLAVAVFPDLHPGKYGPVGAAILAHRIHPEFIGSDIGCGMSLFVLDEPSRKLRVDKAAERLRGLGEPYDGDARGRLEAAGLPFDHADALGTIGGGNHFCEVQAIHAVVDADGLKAAGLAVDLLYLLVHSGSRGFGYAVFESVVANGLTSFDPASEAGLAYRRRHDEAVAWASLNRRVIAERAAKALRMEARLVADVPHNLLSSRNGAVLHRKGAAAAEDGANGLLPIAGTRATLSHLVRWTGGDTAALGSLSHGAGRKYDRAAARVRAGSTKSDLARLARNPFGGVVICEDRALIAEEAALAYKDADKVVGDLVEQGLCARVASLRPLVTFKTTREGGR
jgi:release factor H-coupled RctB family protein